MWWLLRFRWVGARSWELAANSYGARLTASTRRTPQVVEMDPGRDAAGRRSKCCIFVQKSSISEQNHDSGSTVGYMDSSPTCMWGRPPSACRNFWPTWIPTNSAWYPFWPRPLAKLLGWVFWPPEELTWGDHTTVFLQLLSLFECNKSDPKLKLAKYAPKNLACGTRCLVFVKSELLESVRWRPQRFLMSRPLPARF